MTMRERLHELVEKLPEDELEQAERRLAEMIGGEELRIAMSRPMSDRKQQRILAAIEESRRHQAEMLAEHGGVPFSNSWELLDEARQERLEQLP